MRTLLIQCLVVSLVFAASLDVATGSGEPLAASRVGATTDATDSNGAVPVDAPEVHQVAPTAPRYIPIPRARTVITPEPTPVPVDVRAVVEESARRWGVDPVRLVRVAWCESRFDPAAVNPKSGAKGIMQFIDTTWAANSVRYGWPGASPHDPRAAAGVAGAMFARGQAWQWSCK